MQSRARSSYAEPQPSLAVYSQMHCKVTTKIGYLQISTPVACKFLLRNRGNSVNKYKLWQSLPETMALSPGEYGSFSRRSRQTLVCDQRGENVSCFMFHVSLSTLHMCGFEDYIIYIIYILYINIKYSYLLFIIIYLSFVPF